jgi:hypothetical protein
VPLGAMRIDGDKCICLFASYVPLGAMKIDGDKCICLSPSYVPLDAMRIDGDKCIWLFNLYGIIIDHVKCGERMKNLVITGKIKGERDRGR